MLLGRLILIGYVLGTLITAWASPAQGRELPLCRERWSHLYPQQAYQYQSGYRTRESYADYHARIQREQCLKEWTILVYIESGKDLGPYALWDLDEMEASFRSTTPLAGSTLTTDVVAEVRIEGTPGIRRLHLFEDDRPRASRSLEDFRKRSIADLRSPVVERSFSNDRDLAEFVLWGMRRYPSRNLAVVIWGHGRGWKPVRSAIDNWTRAHAFDSSQVAESLARVTQLTGRKIDLFAADSCLMQSADALAAYRDSVRYAIGTDVIQDVLGLPYRRILWELNHGALEKTANPAASFAAIIPRLMLQSFNPRSGSQGRHSKDGAATILLSAVDVDRFNRQSIPALDALSLELATFLRRATPRQIQNLQFLIASTLPLGKDNQDIAVVLGLIDQWARTDAPALRPRIRAAVRAVEASLLAYSRGPIYETDPNASLAGTLPVGLSVWLPQSREELEQGLTRYMTSPFIQRPKTPWRLWLEALYR